MFVLGVFLALRFKKNKELPQAIALSNALDEAKKIQGEIIEFYDYVFFGTAGPSLAIPRSKLVDVERGMGRLMCFLEGNKQCGEREDFKYRPPA